ncbi:MAG: Lsr2 family protein [Rhodococcus sp.]|nr:Lsr2 family protein [Rhodococcus sp. (in: high G+C Gram-positive bacteria)]
MARKVIVELVDDLDDTPIADGEGEHIVFAVNGTEYEIDLNDKNAQESHRKLDYYIEHAAKLGNVKKRGTAAAGPSSRRSSEQTKAIRHWAAANGYEVSSRGRIPAEIEEAFKAAH